MNLQNKKIVVTGGAGFIGSNLIKRIPANNDIIVVDNFSSGSLKKLRFFCKNRRIKTVKEDFRREKQMARRGLWLPSSLFLSDSQIIFITKIIRQFFALYAKS